MDLKKGILSGIAAAVIMYIMSFVFSILYPAYNEWYMTVFADLNMNMMWISTIIFGIFMGIIYSVISKSIPGKGHKKGFNYGVLVWILAGLMWPLMSIGFAPFMISIYDLITGFITYGLAGIVLVAVYNKI